MIKTVSIIGVFKIVNRVISVLVAATLARLLGPEEYGRYIFAMSIGAILVVVAKNGLPQLVTREVAQAHAMGDLNLMDRIRLKSITLSIFTSFILSASAGITVLALQMEDAVGKTAIIIALAIVPITVLSEVLFSLLRGVEKIVQPSMIGWILQPAIFLVLINLTNSETSVKSLLLNYLSALLALFALFVFVICCWPTGKRVLDTERSASNWIRALIPFALISSVNIINQKVDIISLGIMSTQSQVGAYNVALQGANLVALPLSIFAISLAPKVAKLQRANSSSDIEDIYKSTTRYILLSSLAVALFLLAFGRHIIEIIFGAGYIMGYGAMSALIVGQLVNAYFGPVGLFLSMTNHERDTLSGIAVALVINLTLNIILVPLFGMEGAAISTSVSVIAWNIILGYFLKNRLGLSPGPFSRT